MSGRSVGKIIEDRRKELGLTIEECSKKTRISKKFLEGIESDNYDVFPGEVYYLGFLRTYAQLLSLDSNKLIHDYNKQKKIEEPAPLEELTKPLKKELKLPSINKNTVPIILTAFISIIVIVGIILLVTIPKSEKVYTAKKEIVEKQAANENEFILNQRKIVRTFLPGEILVIPDGDYSYKLSIIEISQETKEAKISLSNITDQFILKEKDIIQIDFNENNNIDMQIIVNQISQNGIVFTIERLNTEKGNGLLNDKKIVFKTSTENKENETNSQTLINMNQISVVITASRNGYVRLESDTEGVLEKFLAPYESLKISGKKEIILQITNANYMSVLVNNNPLQLPKDFLIYCIIKLVYDPQNDKYNIVTEFKK